MFFLQRQRKSVDDRAQNFQKFSNTIESFGLVDELEENVIYRPSDIRPEIQKFPIDTVQCCLQEIAFSGIF